MAEKYETSIYGQPQPQTGSGQPTVPGAPAPVQTGGQKYETPIYTQGQTGGQGGGQQTTGGGSPQQTTGGASQQPSGWGIDWSKGGQVTMPQSVQDFGDIASNEAMAQNPANYAAARARLGPMAAGADLVGNVLSPTTALNFVPYVGPELAGAAHEGLKSYASGNDWKTIGEDALGGAGWGAVGHGTAALAPKILPQLTSEGLKAGVTYATHKLFGGLAGGDLFKEGAGLLGVYAGLNKAGEWAGEQAKNVASSPYTQQAIKSLILGGGSQVRQNAGPYDQWIPGQ
jgi:hypothetical protein